MQLTRWTLMSLLVLFGANAAANDGAIDRGDTAYYEVDEQEQDESGDVQYVLDCSCDSCCDPCCGDGVSCGDGVGCGDAVGCCGSGKAKKGKPNPCAGSHKGLYYANDFSYLTDPRYRGQCLGDNFKLMPLGDRGRFGKLDLGGQLRLRYHSETGMGHPGQLGFQDTEEDFLLGRVRLYSNWKANDYVRVYAEGIFADVISDDGYVARPIDRNFGDFLNLFIDVGLTDSTTVRVGRQELLYGVQRLVSPLDWANTRRTFEGVRVLHKQGDWSIDGFLTAFVPVVPNELDEADWNRRFYGLYSSYTGHELSNYDFYYLGYDNTSVGTPVATDFSLHTIGGRVFGGQGDWVWEVEGAYQFGRQSGLMQDHSAGFATGGFGRKLGGSWAPTLWLYYDYASGNDPNNGTFNRFNDLFPLAHKYLGFADFAGRANIASPNVLLTMKPTSKWNLLFWYYYLGAARADDIVPGVGSNTVPIQNLTSDDFAHEIDVIARRAICPRSNILFGYSKVFAGEKIINPVRDADFVYIQWEQNF